MGCFRSAGPAALLVLGLVPAIGTATAADIGRLLGSSDVSEVSALVDAQPGPERAQSVESLIGIVDAGTRRAPAAAEVLCKIKPWSTGDEDRDREIQQILWKHASRETNIWSKQLAILDCASANRVDFYYDLNVSATEAVRSATCSGPEVGYLPVAESMQLVEVIETTNAEIEAGFESETVRSFFPLRNSLRSALIAAHVGVSVIRDDLAEGRKAFSTASDHLDRWNTAEELRRARNGWRLHSDLALLGALYRWVGGDETGLQDLESYADWPPAVQDSAISGAIDPDIDVPEDYVDPVYVERLLPGAAATVRQECERWRFRSYNTRDLARTAADCARQLGEISDFRSLGAFDDCLAAQEANDWYVQLGVASSKADAESWLKLLTTRLTEPELGFLRDSLGVVREGGNWRITTPESFSTAQIDSVRELLITKFGQKSVLFGRSKQY